jgi:hypothetical protein
MPNCWAASVRAVTLQTQTQQLGCALAKLCQHALYRILISHHFGGVRRVGGRWLRLWGTVLRQTRCLTLRRPLAPAFSAVPPGLRSMRTILCRALRRDSCSAAPTCCKNGADVRLRHQLLAHPDWLKPVSASPWGRFAPCDDMSSSVNNWAMARIAVSVNGGGSFKNWRRSSGTGLSGIIRGSTKRTHLAEFGAFF